MNCFFSLLQGNAGRSHLRKRDPLGLWCKKGYNPSQGEDMASMTWHATASHIAVTLRNHRNGMIMPALVTQSGSPTQGMVPPTLRVGFPPPTP